MILILEDFPQDLMVRMVDKSLKVLYNECCKTSYIMTVTTEDGGRQNMFAVEPQMCYEKYKMYSSQEIIILTNARWAMVGIIAGRVIYRKILTKRLMVGRNVMT